METKVKMNLSRKCGSEVLVAQQVYGRNKYLALSLITSTPLKFRFCRHSFFSQIFHTGFILSSFSFIADYLINPRCIFETEHEQSSRQTDTRHGSLYLTSSALGKKTSQLQIAHVEAWGKVIRYEKNVKKSEL